jgi:hypothetical protein
MSHLGPLLAQSLIRNIGGHAARRELDKLSEPLKKLVVLRPEAGGWLERALLDEGAGVGVGGGGFPGGERVGREGRGVFLRRILGYVLSFFWLFFFFLLCSLPPPSPSFLKLLSDG